MVIMAPQELLRASFKAAVAAVDPMRLVPRHLPPKPPEGRTLVVGAGKAAAAMALAVENHWYGNVPLGGMVVTRYGHGLPLERISVVEAGHPLPDEQGERAAGAILAEAGKLGPDDLLLCLLSGGGSSLLSLPVSGVSIADLKRITRELLLCGATIKEINAVRKHLSRILGGRLAASCPAPVLALAISDVTGDDPTHIASGPCAPDPTTYADALEILRRYRLDVPPAIKETFLAGARGERDETPKPGDAAFTRVENRIIGTGRDALMAAAACFRSQGVTPIILGDSFIGEAQEAAKFFAALVRTIRRHGEPWKPPVALLSGGETTVTLHASGTAKPETGRGGRNCEFLLSLAIELESLQEVYAIGCDTDGIDGSEDNAGAVAGPDSLSLGRQKELDASTLLQGHDSYTFFEKIGKLIMTGPTRTNVNDYRAILVL
jgi:hydroxypyruvate reductase